MNDATATLDAPALPALPTTGLRVRPRDLVVAGVVAAVYAIVWAALPAAWWPIHAGGKWFLGVFVVTSGLGALLASLFLLNRDLRLRDQPAVWLGIQIIVWNPISFRAVLAAAEGVGLPSQSHALIALVGLVMLGVPTSIVGMALCGNGWWRFAYGCRALQCFLATWIPLVPGILFLHVLAIAYMLTWDKHRGLNKLAFLLVISEQVAAFFWFFLFCRFE